MLLSLLPPFRRTLSPLCVNCRLVIPKQFFSQELESKYTNTQKEIILKVINDSNFELSSYGVTKSKIKKFSQWRNNNGKVKAISDIELIDGFCEKSAKKLFDSILEGPPKKVQNITKKIKGQILYPYLRDSLRQHCKTVLAVYINVNSVCWTLIDRCNYEVIEWKYYGIDYPDGKKFQITDIFDIAWSVTHQLPSADVYVMKAEAKTLRAAGNDPNNPKQLAVNLQKSQMIAMIVALINAQQQDVHDDFDQEKDVANYQHKIYFLRSSLPYRLYGTLVGTEKVSTEQTVELLLQDVKEVPSNDSRVCVSKEMKEMFRSQKDLQKDMLGHCLLLGLTFMDLCIYRNQKSIDKLLKRGE